MARWTGPLDERSAVALAKALGCLGDPDGDPERQWLAVLRLSGHATPDRDAVWNSHVIPNLGPHARIVDTLRAALMTPSRLTAVAMDLATIERLMQLCRRLFGVHGSEGLLTGLLDAVALALCDLVIRTPYLPPAETRALASMPEVAESLDVLLERNESWPAAMLQTSLVVLAHADPDGATMARKIARVLPGLGPQASRTLVLPATLANALRTILLHPVGMDVETSVSVAGRLARRLCSTGFGELAVKAMDLSDASGGPVSPPAISQDQISARTAMTAAIVAAMGSIAPSAPSRPGARAFANVVPFAPAVRPRNEFV